MERNTLITELFNAMKQDIYCMSEYNGSEPDLMKELIDSNDKILSEYAEVYLQ